MEANVEELMMISVGGSLNLPMHKSLETFIKTRKK